jgi:hypothetical protein
VVHHRKSEKEDTMRMITIPAILVCWVLLRPDLGTAISQNEPNKGKPGDAKADDEKKDKKKPSEAPVSIHIGISVEKMPTIPAGSKIEIRGAEEACRSYHTPLTPIGASGVTFQSLPKCKVDMTVFITGFATKTKPVDLRESTGKMHVVLKSSGELEVDWLPPS